MYYASTYTVSAPTTAFMCHLAFHMLLNVFQALPAIHSAFVLPFSLTSISIAIRHYRHKSLTMKQKGFKTETAFISPEKAQKRKFICGNTTSITLLKVTEIRKECQGLTALPHPLLISLVNPCVCASTHKGWFIFIVIMPLKLFPAFRE